MLNKHIVIAACTTGGKIQVENAEKMSMAVFCDRIFADKSFNGDIEWF
jgi:hypothetical protein